MTSSIHQHVKTKRSLRFGYALFGLLAMFGAAPAQAFVNDYANTFGALSLSPDIGTTLLTVSYDASGALGQLTVKNFLDFPTDSNNLRVNGTNYAVTNSVFTLTALIDKSNGEAQSGSFTLTGDTNYGSGYSGTLLSGTLSGFGSSPNSAGSALKFLFTSLGGSLSSLYSGGQAGIFLNSVSTYPGGLLSSIFQSDWLESETTTADIAPPAEVPEPGTLLLIAGGMVAIRFQRKSRSSQA